MRPSGDNTIPDIIAFQRSKVAPSESARLPQMSFIELLFSLIQPSNLAEERTCFSFCALITADQKQAVFSINRLVRR